MRDWYFFAEQPASAPRLAHPEGCGALRIVLLTVPRVSRSCEHCPNGLDLHLLHFFFFFFFFFTLVQVLEGPQALN